MKQFFAKTRVAIVALFIGALSFVSSEASAQTANTVIAPPPNGNQAWVTIPQAKQTVESEIAALTQQLNILIQNQGSKIEIQTKKFNLQYYMLVQEFLNQGIHVGEALNMAKSSLAGLDGTDYNPKKAEKAQLFYEAAAALMSH
ncbi:MAG: hypothetical protein IPJ06_06525 [Saprospiraceae bacterium]|nr:hypothetical protein [Saprospiraceae bacterium]